LFDYIGDIHLDFWVKLEHSPAKMRKKIYDFVQSILPEHPSDTLFVAGDFGHYNQQSYWFIFYLKEVYETIFFVCGNHDYYLGSKTMKKKYHSSNGRANAFIDEVTQMEGVHRLDGNVHEHKGMRIGGADMWYDFSHALRYEGFTQRAIQELWWNEFNDRKFHEGLLPTLEHSDVEKEKVRDMVCDIFISHVPPLQIPLKGNYATERGELGFYLFDPADIFTKGHPRVWIAGHFHQHINEEVEGIRYLVNSIGYKTKEHTIPSRIQTFDMDELEHTQ